MNESKWMPQLKAVTLNPEAYQTNEEKLEADDIAIVLQDNIEDIQHIFDTYKKDKDFEYLFDHLRGIIADIEVSCSPPLPPATEAVFYDVYALLSEQLNACRPSMSEDQWLEIEEHARHLCEHVHSEYPKPDSEYGEIMNEDLLEKQTTAHEYQSIFASRMKMFRAQAETLTREMLAKDATNLGDNVDIMRDFIKIHNSIKSDWNQLPSEDAPSALSEVRNRCYADITDTEVALSCHIESMLNAGKITPNTYKVLCTDLDTLHTQIKQIPYHK